MYHTSKCLYIQPIRYGYESILLNMTSSKRDDYLFVASIGFGTKYVEYDFSTKDDFARNPPKVYSRKWLDHSSGMMFKRTPTCILFTKEKTFDHFGDEAKVKYTELKNNNEHKEWFFFKIFERSFYALTVRIICNT